MPDTSQAGMKTRAPAPGCAQRRCDSVLGSSRLWHRRARQLAAGGEERCRPCKGQSTTSGAATAPANSRLLKMATKFMPVNLGLNSLLQLKASIGVFLFVCLLFVFNSLFFRSCSSRSGNDPAQRQLGQPPLLAAVFTWGWDHQLGLSFFTQELQISQVKQKETFYCALFLLSC